MKHHSRSYFYIIAICIWCLCINYIQGTVKNSPTKVPITSDREYSVIENKSDLEAEDGEVVSLSTEDDSDYQEDVVIGDETDTKSDSVDLFLTEDEDNVFMTGVLIDFRYNETIPKTESKRVISAPGCPRSIDGIIGDSSAPWVYYGKEGKCYLTGIRGPCPVEMKLFMQPESPWGICKCGCFFNQISTSFDFVSGDLNTEIMLNPIEKRESFCFDDIKHLHYAYFSEKRQCYPLLSQGPCKDNEWFILDPKTNNSKCEVRPCPKSKDDHHQYFFDRETKSCKMLGSLCQKKGMNASLSFRYSVDQFNWIPECKSVSRSGREIFYGLSSSITSSKCQAGHVFSKLLSTCVRRSSRYEGGAIG